MYIYMWARIAQSVQRLAKGLTFQGSNPSWGRGFPHLYSLALGLTQPPVQWVPVFPRGKAAGAWRLPPTPSSAEVKERVAFVACPRMKKKFMFLRRKY